MSSWVTIPSLLKLRDEFNKLSPNRDKGADGTIGDSAHTSTSDHTPDEDSTALRGKDADSTNEVHALDIDSSGPWPPGTTFHKIVMFIVGRCRSGAENRLRYIIHERVIYHVDDGFAGRTYTGDDPHTNHAHFSASYVTARESDTRSWGILEEFAMALDTDDKNWMGGMVATKTQQVLDRLNALEAALGQRVWTDPKFVNPYTGASQPPADFVRYAPSRSPHEATQQQLAALTATVNAFITSELADDATRAQALQAIQDGIAAVAPQVAAQVIAALPQGSDAVSQDEVNLAVQTAFRNAFAAKP